MSRRMAGRAKRQSGDEARDSKRKSKQAKLSSNLEEQERIADLAADPRALSDRLNYIRQPTQMCAYGTLEPH